MLAYVATFLLFTVVMGFPKVREDVAYPSLEITRLGEKFVKFRAFGKDIQLKLEPAGQFISDDFTMVEGENVVVGYSSIMRSIKEKMYRDKKNQASLHVNDDGPLKINGIVNTNLKIEPIEPEKLSEDGRVAHKVVELIKRKYTRHDVISPKLQNFATYRQDSRIQDYCIVVEILFVTESLLTRMFSPKKLSIYLGNAIVGMQTLYETLYLGVTLKLSGTITYNKSTQPRFINANELPDNSSILNTDQLLEAFGDYFFEKSRNGDADLRKLISNSDAIILLTQRFLGDSNDESTFAAGVANIGGICRNDLKYAVCQNDPSFAESIDTFAHELGHLLGMVHDGEPPDKSIRGSPGAIDCPRSDGHLMSYSENAVNKTSFSSCSRTNVANFLCSRTTRCIKETCSCIAKTECDIEADCIEEICCINVLNCSCISQTQCVDDTCPDE